MNNTFYTQSENFSLIESQHKAISKAIELGITFHDNVNDENLWPNQQSNPDIAKLNRFGDRYLDIFGDHSHKYIYFLDNPLDQNEWYKTEYYDLGDMNIEEPSISINHGISESIGLVIWTVELSHNVFSNIKMNEDSVDFYIENKLYARIEKFKTESVSKNDSKEISTLLKGLHNGEEFTTEVEKRKLSKFPGLDKYKGHTLVQDGVFIHNTIKNYVRGFQWILQSLSKDKISLNIAEKVMWAFYGIKNEHILHANEKVEGITYHPFSISIEDEDEYEIHSHLIYKNLPDSIVGFRNIYSDNFIDKEFKLSLGKYIGDIIKIKFIKDDSELILKLKKNDLLDNEDRIKALDYANDFFEGNLNFSTRKEQLVKTVMVKDKEIEVFKIKGSLFIKNYRDKLTPLKPLTINASHASDYMYGKDHYEGKSEDVEWEISESKYRKPTNSVLSLGKLSMDELKHLVINLNIPIYYRHCGFNDEEKTNMYKLNIQYAPDFW